MRVLRSLGFEPMRQSGSHVFYRHADGRTTVIPRHDGEDIGRGLLRQILLDIKISVPEFEKNL